MTDLGSGMFTFLVSFAVAVGIVTAFVLYQTAFAKKEVKLAVTEPSKPSAVSQERPSAIREKIKKIFQVQPNPESAAQAVSNLVEEQARQMTQDIRQEYSVKYQLAVQDKNNEVEKVRRDYNLVMEKYSLVEQLYSHADYQRKQTEAIVKSIAEGLVVVNQKGEVLMMNPSAEKILGVQGGRKVGQSIYEELPNEVLISMARSNKGGAQDQVIEIQSKDENVKKVIRSSSAVIQNEDGQTVGMVNILTDVTKQRELEEIKTKFVSNVTHELRTPIVAIQKAIEILLSPSAGSLNETQSNFLNIVANNLNHLSRLVEDVLDISRIDSGKMKIRFVESRVDKVIDDACQVLETWAKSKNIQIVRNFLKGIPEFSMDPGRVTQVLNNLIGNAIKFTPAGGSITVETSWSKDGKFVCVSVADTGVGISKEHQLRLFKRFEQFGDQVGVSGTGLGLSISKEIVERHGGQIWVESEEKKGAKFTFTLPLYPKVG